MIHTANRIHKGISTHAPRVRRDVDVRSIMAYVKNFYSRASCEARRNKKNNQRHSIQFLLTRLV